MKLPIIFILALALIGAVHAQSDHITLLTVSDDSSASGGTADLYLTIKPGSGAIYIDSFPLTRIDTQGSVRYANQIACDLLQADCSQYDFFYTIRANSAIVGGPSAGGAMAVLTVAVLDGQDIDQRTAMTGTINSGGIIGPVAGVSKKVQGAKMAGMKTVLIPSFTPDIDPEESTSYENASVENASNETAAPVQVPLHEGKDEALSDKDITVIRISTVEEALLEITGKNYSKSLAPLEPPGEYTQRMRTIADEICARTMDLEQQLQSKAGAFNDTGNYSQRIDALDDSHQYSRASLCFSKNIELATLVLQNSSNTSNRALYRQLRLQARELDADIRNRTLTTVGDLETYAIVKERILEAQGLLDSEEATSPRALAYAQERLQSALSWSRFFGMPGKQLELDDQYLSRACLAKLAEADERLNYVRLYAPTVIADAAEILNQAQSYSSTEPTLCIFTASKAKAQANVLANAISIGQENLDALIGQKIDADTLVLQKQQEKEFFPILGTSYTQYASDLRESSPYSALLFSEYALELSNIDIYFPRQSGFRVPAGILESTLLFLFGTVFGVSITMLIVKSRAPKKRKR